MKGAKPVPSTKYVISYSITEMYSRKPAKKGKTKKIKEELKMLVYERQG